MANANGIDLSNNNGYSAVDRLPRSVDFVYCKVTEGESFVDPDARHIYARCHATGRKTGGYHFAHPYNDGAAEARFFLRHLQIASGDLIPALDIEISSKHCRAYAEAFSKVVFGALGCETLLYASRSFVASEIGSQIPHMQLWIADWNVQFPNLPYGWKSWDIWQYKVARMTNVGTVDFDTAKMPMLEYNSKPKAKPEYLSLAQRLTKWIAYAKHWHKQALINEQKVRGIR
jgi:lysozyme